MTTKWFYKAQQAFKDWKNNNDYNSRCLTQNVGKTILTEEHIVWPKSGGAQTYVKLKAFKYDDSATLFVDNKEINLYEPTTV